MGYRGQGILNDNNNSLMKTIIHIEGQKKEIL